MNPLTLAPDTLSDLITRLTPRQLEIVALLAEGQSTKQIATILSIGRRTVKDHVYRACAKLKLDNRIQLIVLYAMWKVAN